MSIKSRFLILTLILIYSCEKSEIKELVDYNPKVSEITYNTPLKMKINYRGDLIEQIEWFVASTLHSTCKFYYTESKVDSSIYVEYSSAGLVMETLVSYYKYNELERLIQKIDKNIFHLDATSFVDYHYGANNNLVRIVKYNESLKAIVDSLIYDSDNKLKFYLEFEVSNLAGASNIDAMLKKYEVFRYDNYTNPFYQINKTLGVYYSTEFGYMTENNLIENSIQDDSPQTYNHADLKYDKNKRLISIDDKIFFKY